MLGWPKSSWKILQKNPNFLVNPIILDNVYTEKDMEFLKICFIEMQLIYNAVLILTV